jgi:hypothetical protein
MATVQAKPTSVPASRPDKDAEPTIGGLVIDASRDISTLISKEIQLAKSELKVSVKHGGVGIGLFAGAAFIGILAVIMLSIAIAYFLSMTGLHLAWCFLIVFGTYLLLAGLLAFIGLRQVKQVKAPERAISQGKEIPAALRGRA